MIKNSIFYNNYTNLFKKPIYLLNIKTSNYTTTTTNKFNNNKKWFDLNSRSPYLLLHTCFKSIFEKALTKEEIDKIFKNDKTKFQPTFSQVPSKKLFDYDYSLNNLVVASMLLKDNNKEENNGEKKKKEKNKNNQDNNNNNLGNKLIESFNKNKLELPFSNMIEKIELGNKGHLNLKVSEEYLKNILKLWTTGIEDNDDDLFKIKNLKYQGDENNNHNNNNNNNNQFNHDEKLLPIRNKKVLVDFASPNMSKELHVGHLRSIALGESVCRILEYMGHDVERISHAGDFGTPMGIVIAHSLDTKADYLRHIIEPTKENIENKIIPTPKQLSELYTAAKNRCKTDAEFSKRTLLTAAELQKGPLESDPIIYQSWIALCEASRVGFNKVFDMLNINVKERGESFYREMLPSVVDDLTKLGFVHTSEDGRKCIFLDETKDKESQVPVIIQKSDGAYLYATTDIAAIKHRVSQGKEWVIVITDDSQTDHFQQVFKIAENANWLDRSKTRVDHLSFGVVRGSDGLKLSSRDGTPVALIDLLYESIERSKQATSLTKSFTRSEKLDQHQNAYDIEIERLKDSFENDNHSNNNSNSLSTYPIDDKHFQKIGMGALKYFDLTHRNNPYIFSYESILSFKGNTSIYILYCYTRISTLFERVDFKNLNLNPNLIEFNNFTDKERNLIFLMSRFSDIMKNTESSLKPGIICDYLWDISNSFHQFYETEKIIGNPRQDQKLLICLATQRILSTGLNLLGVETVERL